MNKTIPLLCSTLGLVVGVSQPALAGHRDYDGYRDGYRDAYYAAPAKRHHHAHRNWVAPAAVVAITGIAAGIAASTYYAPRPVYVAPPPVYVPPPRPVYVVPERPVYVVPAQPVYAPAVTGYWGY